MKKMISFLLTGILVLITCIALTACNKPDSSAEINNQGSDNSTSKSFDVDLAGCIANIGTAKAVGISKETVSRASNMSTRKTKNSKIRCLSHTTLSSTNTEEKNYIVTSSINYDANTPEADKTGLTKVTFTKIVTEKVTTETTGTKYLTANNGALLISATTGFKYTVYYNDLPIYNDVQDNDANDRDNRLGIIELDNLISGAEYRVSYKGIGEEITITQDDIDGEIDKLYVVNEYTFISFVPEGQSLRPNDSDLHYDVDGIAAYDKCEYFSGTNRQSFVIDNTTGYVYQLKDFSIDLIKDGLIVSSDKYFDMSVTDDMELNFVQVVRNETIHIYNIFKDKYGNKYVQNDYLDAYDIENKTIYFTKTNYFLSAEGIAIHIDYTGQFNSSEMPSGFTVIEKIDEGFCHSQISETEDYKINYSPCNDNSSHNKSDVMISHISNGYLYMYSTQGGAYSYFKRVNTISKEQEDIRYGHDGENWSYNCLKSLPIDYNTVLIWSDWSGNAKLYYGEVWGDQGFRETGSGFDGNGFNDSKLTVLLENCICVPDWEFNLDILKFRHTTFEGTIFYKIVIDENGLPTAVNSETYVAPKSEVVTLQPINR